jgi:multisubunit Na+/H+ antiporter MnhC subunit
MSARMFAIREWPWLDAFSTLLTVLLFLIGLLCLLTQRNVIKQVIGLKIMLQGVTLSLIHAGDPKGLPRPLGSAPDVPLTETMVISALIVETVVIAIALALIVNTFRHDPTGDIDRLDRLRG